MEDYQTASHLSFLEPEAANEQIHVHKELELCFQTEHESNRTNKSTPPSNDLLDFHSAQVTSHTNITELSHSLLETFASKQTSEALDNSMESLLKNKHIDSVEKAELSDQFLSSLDPRELLGLDAHADFEQIRSAYKKKLLKMHPDKNPNMSPKEAEMFRRLTEAYDKLMKSSG